MKVLHGPFAVDGHELVADLVVGCVEREGETEFSPAWGLDLLLDSAESIDASDGGDGDGGHGDGGAGLVGQACDGAEDFIEVVEWFTHAHEDDVVDVHALDVAGGPPLGDDFFCGQ